MHFSRRPFSNDRCKLSPDRKLAILSFFAFPRGCCWNFEQVHWVKRGELKKITLDSYNNTKNMKGTSLFAFICYQQHQQSKLAALNRWIFNERCRLLEYSSPLRQQATRDFLSLLHPYMHFTVNKCICKYWSWFLGVYRGAFLNDACMRGRCNVTYVE